ncbi:MAG: amino acid adenylation domain-containing protein [Flavobacteriales bacterium]|jgi:amino acid adenylation domain-containing protein|nr:amino acid adenylation domain-containing protein [Flavobacteriales bacterium]
MEKFITEPAFHPVDFDPFGGPAIARTAPSTEAQREVWVASQMSREASCAYIESVSLELTGELGRDLIERTIHLLVERHEGLRSTISANGLRVIVQEKMDVPFTFEDLSGLGSGARDQRLDTIAHADTHTPFDLLNGPLFRVHLIRLAADKHLLRLSGHHVIVDGWSLGVIMADVSRIHSALKRGTAPELPEAFRFSDYAIAQLDFARTSAHDQVEGYWLGLFKDGLPRVDLPTDRPRPHQKTYNGHRLDLEMDPALVRKLRETATRSGASFVTTLLTSFEVLLYQLTGDNDLCVGLPAAGQSDFGMKDLVGHCVNLLALRSRIDEGMPFIDHLKARRTGVLDAFDHQKYTFGTLVRKLNVPREPGRIPLCPVVFNIDMNMDDEVRFDAIAHRFISNPRDFEHFELFLNATGGDDRLVLEWSYNTDLFDAATVRGWMARFTALIAHITERPEATIAELASDTVARDEASPATDAGLPSAAPVHVPVHDLFDQVAAAHGERIALEMADARLTYRELQGQVHALSAHLVELGVRPGEPVGLCMDRSFGMIVAMLAVLRAGGCYVPLDPAYPAERLRFMFTDTDVQVLLTQRHLISALPLPAGQAGSHRVRTVLVDEAPRAAGPAPMPALTGDAPAYIMYTSGSTGTPKGTVIPHRAIVRLVRDQDYLPFGPDLVFLQLSNVSFDASTFEIWGALLNGAKLVLQPQQKPTLVEITQTVRRHGVTTVWFTAGLFNLMVDEHLDRLRGLRHILAGGDVLSPAHVRKAFHALGPGVLINGYGPTENTTFTTCHRIDTLPAQGTIPIGRALRGTTVHVLDDAMRPVPAGRKGELYAGGAGVALGYWKRDELTAERFVPDPFSGTAGAMLYRTGDIVRRLPDGTLEFIGRGDGQVKVRGYRVELGEIESAIAASPEVRDTVVMARRDGPGEPQLAAYVVPRDFDPDMDHARRDALIERLRAHVEERLPGYMAPAFYTVLATLPLTPNGKVDKQALPAPTMRTSTLQTQHVAPRNEVERTVAAIWRRALGVDDLGVHDNFFDLGGHSLIGIQVLSQVEQQTGRKLPLNTLFQAPTVAQFAASIHAGELADGPRYLATIQKEGGKLPLFCVHGDEANYFLSRDLGKDQPFHGFFHQGEDGHPMRYTTVTDIAAHFIEEMRQVRPTGPYLLCGFSFGGLVAYEMARQLARAGEQVPFLALLDTYAPDLYRAVMAEESTWYEPIKKAAMRRAVRFYRQRGRPLPPKLRHFHIIDTYDQATRAYTIGPYDGPMLLIKAERSPGPAHMGWDGLVRDLRVAVSPGDHFDMIKDPHAPVLARHVAAGIEAATRHIAAEAG